MQIAEMTAITMIRAMAPSTAPAINVRLLVDDSPIVATLLLAMEKMGGKHELVSPGGNVCNGIH